MRLRLFASAAALAISFCCSTYASDEGQQGIPPTPVHQQVGFLNWALGYVYPTDDQVEEIITPAPPIVAEPVLADVIEMPTLPLVEEPAHITLSQLMDHFTNLSDDQRCPDFLSNKLPVDLRIKLLMSMGDDQRMSLGFSTSAMAYAYYLLTAQSMKAIGEEASRKFNDQGLFGTGFHTLKVKNGDSKFFTITLGELNHYACLLCSLDKTDTRDQYLLNLFPMIKLSGLAAHNKDPYFVLNAAMLLNSFVCHMNYHPREKNPSDLIDKLSGALLKENILNQITRETRYDTYDTKKPIFRIQERHIALLLNSCLKIATLHENTEIADVANLTYADVCLRAEIITMPRIRVACERMLLIRDFIYFIPDIVKELLGHIVYNCSEFETSVLGMYKADKNQSEPRDFNTKKSDFDLFCKLIRHFKDEMNFYEPQLIMNFMGCIDRTYISSLFSDKRDALGQTQADIFIERHLDRFFK